MVMLAVSRYSVLQCVEVLSFAVQFTATGVHQSTRFFHSVTAGLGPTLLPAVRDNRCKGRKETLNAYCMVHGNPETFSQAALAQSPINALEVCISTCTCSAC